MWTEGLTVEIELRFQIPPAYSAGTGPEIEKPGSCNQRVLIITSFQKVNLLKLPMKIPMSIDTFFINFFWACLLFGQSTCKEPK